MTLTLLEEITQKLGALSPDDKKAVIADAVAATAGLKLIPSPGRQTEAYFSQADCLLYGGEPGGGKSFLLLALAFNCHQRSLIMRRQYGDLERIIEDALKVHGSRDGFNGSPPPRLRVNENKIINFRAAQHIGDEQGTMGQGRDFLGLDEATHFAESQVRFLMGWVRSEDPNQRCRTVLATNPPLTAEGLWVNKMFAPWLDPNHPYPARHGELRWVVSDEDGKDEWVDGPGDARSINGKIIRPTSRSYIPSSVRDNPYYAASDYERQLDALPEPYRSLLMGGFKTSFKDADFQVIPTAWIEAAQARWKPDGYKAFAMTAMAVDPAGGGADAEEIATRYGGWYAPMVTEKGESTADPAKAFGHIMATRRDNAPVVVDVGGGYGDKIVLRLKDNSVPYVGFNGASKAPGRSIGSNIPFANLRAKALWRLREELDPDQQGGSPIALPPDPELKADLAAPRYDAHALQVRGVYLIESKEDLRKRLGRSTGKGDAVAMCLTAGDAAVKRAQNNYGPRQTMANRGFEHMKKRH